MIIKTAGVTGVNPDTDQVNLDTPLPGVSKGDQTIVPLHFFPNGDVMPSDVVEIHIENGEIVSAQLHNNMRGAAAAALSA